MKIERKVGNRTRPKAFGQGPACERSFDGYHFVLHFFDGAQRDVRVIFERHEAVRFAEFIQAECKKQRERVEEVAKVADQVLG